MKTLLLTTGAIALASAAAPAFAQDAAPADAAPVAATTTAAYAPADVATFTGPRAEIFGGWDRVGTRFRSYDSAGDRSTVKGHKNGGTAGALVGYDMPLGDRLVAGVFGSYALSTARTCDQVGTYSGCLKSGRQIEGGARIGAKAMNDKALVYLKGAYVNGQLRTEFSDGTNVYRDHDNQDGWRAGAGVEYAIAKHAYVKVEYDYTRFKSYDGQVGTYDTALRFDRNQVLGGFGVRF